jgi:hypothetical protein
MSRLRKTQRQEVSCPPGHLMKTTAGTSMTELMTMMAPPATIVPETTAVTTAVVMTIVMSTRFLQSSAASSQAPTVW